MNVNLPKGEKQSQVMAALVEKCKEEGWDKSKLVDYKNGLLAESLAQQLAVSKACKRLHEAKKPGEAIARRHVSEKGVEKKRVGGKEK